MCIHTLATRREGDLGRGGAGGAWTKEHSESMVVAVPSWFCRRKVEKDGGQGHEAELSLVFTESESKDAL